MLPRGWAWLYSGRVAEPDKPAPGSEEWWGRVLTDPKEHGTVESLERVLA
jgi:hypothetical protein